MAQVRTNKGRITTAFSKQQQLGKGAFAFVFKCEWVEDEKEPCIVAVKRIEEIRYEEQWKQDEEGTREREESAMNILQNHDNVLKLLDVGTDVNFKYFVLELCDATLEAYCQGEYTGFKPAVADSLYQMACGLQHIHRCDLVHRDLSTGNVLIKSMENSTAQWKISDFGFCKPVSENGSFSVSKNGVGTQHFLSPEMINAFDIKDKERRPRATQKCDIFSLGCLFFYFAFKKHPFERESRAAIPSNITKGKRYNGPLDRKPQYIHKVIDGMIEKRPEDRMDLEEVKELLLDHRGDFNLKDASKL